MSRLKGVSKQQVLNATFCLIWLFLLNVMAEVFVPHVPAWPIFLATIFIRFHSQSIRAVLLLFATGTLGIVIAAVFLLFFGLAIDGLGPTVGWLLVLFALLATIFYGRLLFPTALDTPCFAYLSLYFIMPGNMTPISVLELLAMSLIGGGLAAVGFICASILSNKLLKQTTKQ